MNWLVTGGAGFIGSHLVDRLIGEGHTVYVVDDLSTGSQRNCNPKAEFIKGDIRHLRYEDWGKKFDHIVHLAAAVGVSRVMKEPLESFEVNIDGTRAMLQYARDCGAEIFIASTSEVYGLTRDYPCREEQPLCPGDPTKLRWGYAVSKLADECLALSYQHTWGTPVRIGRLFNTVGPRQSPAYGMVLPRFVEQALGGKKLSIYGNGMQTRCFIHVLDTVEAILALCNTSTTQGQIYNIGTETETTIWFLAKTVLERVGRTHERDRMEFFEHEEIYGKKFEDMPRRVPDISKIKAATRWSPQRNLIEIIDSTIAEYQKNA